ncbi:MAG: 50S ribosomal protein L11 methyltransferase [Oscillospiraceae bacterium]|nr:50S ribosomal protein L11 methyltransferase [Oscillospiraceae bacterium]
MAWLELTVHTAPGQTEDTAAQLTAAGFSDLVIEDEAQFEDFLQENRACWDYIDEELQEKLKGLCQIKLYIEDTDENGLARFDALADKLCLSVTRSLMQEENWEESWKENYPAVEIGEKLVVLPYWLVVEDHGSRLQVILDPGLTFGTGTHPSTQMVLRAMEKQVKPGSRCLDLGSGSGILSIAALRLGAKEATGVDIDPKAEDIARENAAYNQFASPAFTALTGNVTTDKNLMQRLSTESWDTVLVNIVADVIICLAPTLPAFLKPHTRLICSGILDSRLRDVVSALNAAGITVTQTFAQEDWRCILAKKE